MDHRLTHISPFKTAAVGGIIGGVLGIPLAGIMHIFSSFSSRPNYTPLHLEQVVAVSVFLAVLSLLLSFLGSITYNLLAKTGLTIQFTVKRNETAKSEVE